MNHIRSSSTLAKENTTNDALHIKRRIAGQKTLILDCCNEKRHGKNPKAQLSISQALITIRGTNVPMHNQALVSCGATHHMFNSPKFLPNSFKEIRSKVATGDPQNNLLAPGIGNTELKCNGQILNLKNCILVPKVKSFPNNHPKKLLTFVNGNLWHCHLGHPVNAVLRNLGLPDQEHYFLTCNTSKSHQIPFLHQFEPFRYPFQTIHIDVAGHITPESISGSSFLLTITDQATSYKTVSQSNNVEPSSKQQDP
ncbi:hypothetical protein O181_080772 [Austropuccinia psidii MF-1]|uniref:GAG-pre-integrase domain-containing protein n=1 Tax=Austropuccinia psidii MF-1 TaxID=1389203 RepID=A0A9Q3FM91_9BASI|nr:hypothetical protein [Austropuccinia psidii MF-1]